ncbi:MAG: imidazolonepropionase [Bacteriovoracales bacterium]
MIKAYRNFSQIVTLAKAFKKDGRNLLPEDLSIIENGSVVFNGKEILWVGKDSDFPAEYQNILPSEFDNKILVPELVDSHTHLVFGGDRSSEYSMRLNGASYEEIRKSGGGIVSTMKSTHSFTHEELFEISSERIEQIYSYGVGTVEIKSGYGLSFEKEKEISLLINDLKKKFEGKVQIFNTYMAAHAVPAEFSSSHEYMEKVVIPLLKDLAPLKIIDAVDIFHEKHYFDTFDCQNLFKEAKNLGIKIKIHADEFLDNKGTILATKFGALSCDHLLNTGKDGINALANSQTVATLLPGTGFFLGLPQANARAFLDAGVKVAIGSDYNPGSCHCDNLLLVASLAAPHYKMNLCELWAAITLNASHSLGLKDQGAIIKGLKPRFSIFEADSIDKITYHWGKNLYLAGEH